MDVELDVSVASDQIDTLIERRAEQGAAERAREALWKASVARYHEQRGQENRATWFGFFLRMADSHARISEDYQRRAQALCEGRGEGSR